MFKKLKQQVQQAIVQPGGSTPVKEVKPSVPEASTPTTGSRAPTSDSDGASPQRPQISGDEGDGPASDSGASAAVTEISMPGVASPKDADGPSSVAPAELPPDGADQDSAGNANVVVNLASFTKEEIFQKFRDAEKVTVKYKDKYVQVLAALKEAEKARDSLKETLEASQEKSIRRLAELREQCELEKLAKRDLEANYHMALEERNEQIEVLRTQIRFFKDSMDSTSSETAATATVSPAAAAAAKEESEELTSLRDKVKRLEGLLTKCKETIKNGKDRVVELTREKDELTTQLEAARITAAALAPAEQARDAAAAESEALRRAISRRDEELATLKETYAAQLDQCRAETLHHEQDRDAWKSKCQEQLEKSRDVIKRLQDEKKAAVLEADEQRKAFAAADHRLHAALADLEALRASRDELSLASQHHQDEAAELREQIEKLREEVTRRVADAEQRATELQARLSAAEEERSATEQRLRDDAADLRRQIVVLHDEASTQRSAAAIELQAQLAAGETLRLAADADRERLSSLATELQEQCTVLRAELDLTSKVLADEREAVQQRLADVGRRAADEAAAALRQHFEALLESRAAEVQRLQHEKEALVAVHADEAGRLREAVAELSRQRDEQTAAAQVQAAAELEALRVEHEREASALRAAMSGESGALQERLRGLEERLERSTEAARRAELELATAQALDAERGSAWESERAGLLHSAAELTSALEESRACEERLREACARQADELDCLRRSLTERESAAAALQDAYGLEKAELQRELCDTRQALEADAESLRRQLAALSEGGDAAEAERTARVAALEEQRAEALQRLEQAEAAARAERAALDSELETAARRAEAAESRLAEESKAIAELRSASEREHAEAERIVAGLRAESEAAAVQARQQLVEAVNATRADGDRRCAELEAQLVLLTADKERLHEQLSASLTAADDTMRQLAELQDGSERDLAAARQEMDGLRRAAEDQCAALRQELAASAAAAQSRCDEAVSVAEFRLAEAQAELDELRQSSAEQQRLQLEQNQVLERQVEELVRAANADKDSLVQELAETRQQLSLAADARARLEELVRGVTESAERNRAEAEGLRQLNAEVGRRADEAAERARVLELELDATGTELLAARGQAESLQRQLTDAAAAAAAEAEAALRRHADEMADLTRRLEAAEVRSAAEEAALSERLATMTDRARELQEQLDRLSQERTNAERLSGDGLRRALDEADAAWRDKLEHLSVESARALQEKEREMHDQLLVSGSALSARERDLADLKAMLQQKDEAAAAVSGELAASAAASQQLTERCAHLAAEVDHLRNELEAAAVSAADRLAACVCEAERSQLELRQQLQDAQATITSMATEHAEKDAAATKMATELESRLRALEQSHVEEMRREVAAASEHQALVERELLVKARLELDALRLASDERVRLAVEEAESKAAKSKETLTKAKALFAEKLRSKEQEVTNRLSVADQELKQKEEALAAAREELARAKADLQALASASAERHLEQAVELERMLSEAQRELAEIKAASVGVEAALSDKIATLEEALSSERERAGSLEHRLADARSEADGALAAASRQHADELAAAKDKADRAYGELRQKFAAKLREVQRENGDRLTALSADLEGERRERLAADERLLELERRAAAAEAELSKAAAAATERCTSCIRLEAELSETAAALKAQNDNYALLSSAFAEERTAAADRAADLEQRMAELEQVHRSEMETAGALSSTLRGQLRDVEQRLADSEQRLADSKQRLADLNTELATRLLLPPSATPFAEIHAHDGVGGNSCDVIRATHVDSLARRPGSPGHETEPIGVTENAEVVIAVGGSTSPGRGVDVSSKSETAEAVERWQQELAELQRSVESLRQEELECRDRLETTRREIAALLADSGLPGSHTGDGRDRDIGDDAIVAKAVQPVSSAAVFDGIIADDDEEAVEEAVLATPQRSEQQQPQAMKPDAQYLRLQRLEAEQALQRSREKRTQPGSSIQARAGAAGSADSAINGEQERQLQSIVSDYEAKLAEERAQRKRREAELLTQIELLQEHADFGNSGFGSPGRSGFAGGSSSTPLRPAASNGGRGMQQPSPGLPMSQQRSVPLSEPTELEYLRNVLFEYMMGRETQILAKVISTIMRFSQEQLDQILDKEESKLNSSWLSFSK